MRWITELEQFTFEIAPRGGEKLPDADALLRRHITNGENIEQPFQVLVWEGTEKMHFHKLQVPESFVKNTLDIYHSSP